MGLHSDPADLVDDHGKPSGDVARAIAQNAAELARLRAIEAAARAVVADGPEWWGDDTGCLWCGERWEWDDFSGPATIVHAPDCPAFALDAALARLAELDAGRAGGEE